MGGGYHGKSTLLKALESGVYNHIPGDGREYVITDETAVKLRAEDGRSINHVDISLFIRDLPNKKDTTCFSTADASGSTSQAAAVIESIEAGTRAFLIDEDTSATNFMLRDDLMQRIVSRDKEPIAPFIERARDLYKQAGISTVLVAGSSGAYFFIADTIIQMDAYRPFDITEMVKNACEQEASKPAIQAPGFKLPTAGRKLAAGGTGRAVGAMALDFGDSRAEAGGEISGRGRKQRSFWTVWQSRRQRPPMQDVLNAVAEDAAKLTEIPTGTRVSKSVSTTNTLSSCQRAGRSALRQNSLPTASRPPHSPRWCATAWKKAFWSAAPYRKRLPHS
ncbi:MAG: P-loop domain-containing protein [Clostridium fessum]